MRGFTRSRQASERLAAMGVDQGQARQIYSQAQKDLPTLDALAQRWRDKDPSFGIGEFESAALGDADQQGRVERLVGAEQSAFTGQRRVEQDRTGGLAGLRSR